MLETRNYECEVGGRNLVIETGKLARQADEAVTVQWGDTVVLVTLCAAEKPREGVDFLPLTVDYEERLYAAGKIPGGFIRREGRPSQEATLTSRMTDRPLRPLLPKEWRREIQLVITVLSVDHVNDPDVLALIGSSAVLHMSEIPFAGPVGAVHVGYINDELVLNPTLPQMESSQLDLIVASTRDTVVMIEAGCQEVSEELVLQAIEFGHQANQDIIRLQEQMREDLGKPKEEPPSSAAADTEVAREVLPIIAPKLEQAVFQPDKLERDRILDGLKKELSDKLGEQFSEGELVSVLEGEAKRTLRSGVLDHGKRVSGRGLTEVR